MGLFELILIISLTLHEQNSRQLTTIYISMSIKPIAAQQNLAFIRSKIQPIFTNSILENILFFQFMTCNSSWFQLMCLQTDSQNCFPDLTAFYFTKTSFSLWWKQYCQCSCSVITIVLPVQQYSATKVPHASYRFLTSNKNSKRPF